MVLLRCWNANAMLIFWLSLFLFRFMNIELLGQVNEGGSWRLSRDFFFGYNITRLFRYRIVVRTCLVEDREPKASNFWSCTFVNCHCNNHCLLSFLYFNFKADSLVWGKKACQSLNLSKKPSTPLSGRKAFNETFMNLKF